MGALATQHRKHKTRGALFAAALAVVSWAHDAGAATEAERLFQLGRRASEVGKFATACSLFRESFRLEPAVGTLLNLGDCEEQQNHMAAALEYFGEALSRLGVTDDRLPVVRARIEAIERRSGTLEIVLGDGAPAETRVTVDGDVIPPEKRKKILLPVGGHLVQVTAVGYRGSRQQADIAAGTTKKIVVWPGPQLEATELALLTSGPSEEQLAAERADARARTMRTVGFGVLGLGVAGLWVGSLGGAFAIDREALRRENCDADNRCNKVGFDAARSGRTFATVATVGLSVGVLASVSGAILVLSNAPRAPADRPQERPPGSTSNGGRGARLDHGSTQLASELGPGFAGLRLERSF